MESIMIITIIYFSLFIVSAIPLIQLKYNHDVASYTENMTEYCNKNDKRTDHFDLPEFHKYLYMICDTLYDTQFTTEIVPLSREVPFHMKVYKQYSDMSYAFFILCWIGFISYFILFFINYSKEYIRLSLIFVLFFLLVGITVVFSLILKKITEIYNDTFITNYYNFMTKLKTGLYEYRTNNNKKFVELSKNILYENDKIYNNQYSNYVSNIVFNSENIQLLYNHLKKHDNDIELKELLEEYNKFHNKDHISKIKYKIDVVISYLFMYFLMLVLFVFFIVKILKEQYYININFLFMTIITGYILALLLYYVIRYLH